jgi:AcrR family transcriptional regulator
MAGRPRSRSDAEILAAVLRAAAASGGADVTLAAIAQEAGLAASTLVERFGSRRALLLAAASSAADGVDAAFDTAIAERGSPLETLVTALVALSAPLRTRAALARQIGVLRIDVADPGFRELADRHSARLRARVADLLSQARAADELATACDVDALARAVHVAYNGSLVTWGIGGAGRQDDALRQDIAAVLAPYSAVRRR